MIFLYGLLFFPSIIGLFVIWHIVRPQKSPADNSNRINKIRLFWFALTREGYIAQFAPWVQMDEMEKINGE